MAQGILGDPERASELEWPAQLKRKDWGLYGRRPKIPMGAIIEHFPERRKVWTGSEFPKERPGLLSTPASVKVEGLNEESAGSAPGLAAPVTPADIRDINDRKRPGGPVQPPAKRARGSTARAIAIASSEVLMSKARMNLSELTYAPSTAATKESRGKLYVQIAEARNIQPFPLTPAHGGISEVAAVLRAADFVSGYQYLLEAKQLHVRQGHQWDESLELSMQDADGALGRALGPTRKAAEIRPQLWAEWLRKPKNLNVRGSTQPCLGPEIWCLGTAFLLREVELAHLLMSSVSFDLDNRTVTLKLSMSKEPKGRGHVTAEPGRGPVD